MTQAPTVQALPHPLTQFFFFRFERFKTMLVVEHLSGLGEYNIKHNNMISLLTKTHFKLRL